MCVCVFVYVQSFEGREFATVASVTYSKILESIKYSSICCKLEHICVCVYVCGFVN